MRLQILQERASQHESIGWAVRTGPPLLGHLHPSNAAEINTGVPESVQVGSESAEDGNIFGSSKPLSSNTIKDELATWWIDQQHIFNSNCHYQTKLSMFWNNINQCCQYHILTLKMGHESFYGKSSSETAMMEGRDHDMAKELAK